MIEATKARTSPTTSPVEKPKNEMPNFGAMEVPAAFHEMADKGVAQARAATEQATNLFQNTYTVAAKGAADYNLKVIEIARSNTNAALDYAHQLFGVKSFPEFVELSSANARKQFEAMTAQTKELTTLAQKVAMETAEPLKTGLTGPFINKVG
jgi:phasin